MTVLDKLCECGLYFHYFEICDISKIDSKWCSGIKVIDFDQIAAKVCTGQLSSLRSCDALRISRTKYCMDFIELKSIEELILWAKSTKKCLGKVKDFNLYGKIYDSLVIMRNMISHGEFKFTSEEINDFYQVPKNFIIAIDTKEPLGTLNSTLALLASVPNSPKKLAIETLREMAINEINNQIKDIEENGLIKLNSVTLMTFHKIYEYYNT